MSMNRFFGVLLLGIAQIATVQAEVSASLTLASDYVFRGISNTDEDPAIQGSFDYEHELGFYAGVWASNVKFRENADAAAADTVDEASIEIDYYLGFSSAFGNGITWDMRALSYTYPGAQAGLEYGYWELLAAVGHTYEHAPYIPEVGVEVYYSPEYFGKIGAAYYAAATLNLSLPHEFGLGFSLGRQWFDNQASIDYSDWKVELSKTIAGIEIAAAYTDTSLSRQECGDVDLCEGRAVFSITKSIE